jgi:hypothetical protein
MLIQTQADALAALGQAQTDLQNTQSQLQVAYTNSQGFFANLSGTAISSTTNSDAQGLISDLEDLLTTILNSLGGNDSDPLLQPQIDAMKSLQTQIINARSIVNQVISNVDWTFGDYLGDLGTTAVNTASQAVGAISKGLGINWTYVKWGLAIGGVILFIGLYQRVRG